MLLRRRERNVVETAVQKCIASTDNEKMTNDPKQYSRSEIARMSTADLKEVAKTLGLEVTEESTGKMLKEQILEKLGL